MANLSPEAQAYRRVALADDTTYREAVRLHSREGWRRFSYWDDASYPYYALMDKVRASYAQQAR